MKQIKMYFLFLSCSIMMICNASAVFADVLDMQSLRSDVNDAVGFEVSEIFDTEDVDISDFTLIGSIPVSIAGNDYNPNSRVHILTGFVTIYYQSLTGSTAKIMIINNSSSAIVTASMDVRMKTVGGVFIAKQFDLRGPAFSPKQTRGFDLVSYNGDIDEVVFTFMGYVPNGFPTEYPSVGGQFTHANNY